MLLASRVYCLAVSSFFLLMVSASPVSAELTQPSVGIFDVQRVSNGHETEDVEHLTQTYESRLAYYQNKLTEAARSGASKEDLEEQRAKYNEDLKALKDRIENPASSNDRVRSSLEQSLDRVAKANGIEVILNRQSVLYGGIDVTSQVMASLPAETNSDQISLDGIGQSATRIFTLRKGLAIFRMQHSGSSNFAVWLLNDQGERKDLLANTAGSFEGSKAVGVRGGAFLLDVMADGPWTISIEQPKH